MIGVLAYVVTLYTSATPVFDIDLREDSHSIWDREYFHSLVTNPRKHLNGGMRLEHTRIYECGCHIRNPCYNRLHEGNLRTKAEDLICSHAKGKGLLEQSVRLLGLGSGGCLQDLMIVARLADEGAKSIHITLIEPNEIDAYSRAYSDFVNLLNCVGIAYDISISCQRFSYVDDVNGQERFDIVYAVDFDTFNYEIDYSGRGPANNAGNFDPTDYCQNPYFATMDLFKAINLMNNTEQSLAVFTIKDNTISLSPGPGKSGLYHCVSLSEVGPDFHLDKFDLLYINANINVLFINLEYIIQAKKHILINKAIIREEDRAVIEALLNRYQVHYTFIDDDEMVKNNRLGKVLIIYYTVYNPKDEPDPIPQAYKLHNLYIIRLYSIESDPEDLKMSIFNALIPQTVFTSSPETLDLSEPNN